MNTYAFHGRAPLYLWLGQAALYVTGYAVGSVIGWAWNKVAGPRG